MSAVVYQSQEVAPGHVAYNTQQPPAYTQPGHAPYQQIQTVPVHSQNQNVVVVTQPGVQRVGGNCPYCGIGSARTGYTMSGKLN